MTLNTKNPVDFFTNFAGTHKAYGMVIDPLGRISKQLTGLLHGKVEGDHSIFTLHEEFTFDDGAPYQRDWRITRKTPTLYEATADDVIGVASAAVTGNIITWYYPQRLAMGKNGFVVDIVDIMQFMPDGVTLGFTKIRKFGLPIGKLVTTFQRQ
jgi:hypothetical protein